jgi:hypothetical protein
MQVHTQGAVQPVVPERLRDARRVPSQRLPVARELGETSLCFL